jgi:CheY-like chemotaxis protein
MARTRSKKPKSPVVLVAEDEPTVRTLAESNIAELGYTTLTAGNAREALAILDAGESVDVLFTDINMPDEPDSTEGLELARRAVELHPGLRVIYTTGDALTDGMAALFVDGATFLQKPYNREKLMKAVQDAAEAEPSKGT